jgi:uncharacterized protein (TIGR03086 family)
MCADPRLDQARAAFGRRLRAVGPDDWGLPTPCTQWDVRRVVNHVVGHEFRMALLYQGGSLERFVATREDDFLGRDALAAWDRGCRELDAVIGQPGAMERTVHYRGGPTTGRVLLSVCIFEMTVHTWDLARGLGADEALDAGLVTWLLDELEPGSGPLDFVARRFPVAGPPPAGASPQEKLLHLCGRSFLAVPGSGLSGCLPLGGVPLAFIRRSRRLLGA